MNGTQYDFFWSLFRRSLETLERFPITLEPAKMSYITDTLEPETETERADHPFANPEHAPLHEAGSEPAGSAGMNTTGMLLDRLSILSMKHWNLRNRASAPDKAEELVNTQIKEIIEALAEARIGQSSINNKMTSRRSDIIVDDFGSAYYGLLSTNMLLWEAQEILYNHDISVLPCEELRAYIDFFSRGNIARNAYIQASDQTYWATITRA